MEILVIVGEVPATDMEIQCDRWLNAVDPDDIVYTTSRYDLQAVEEALRIRDSQKKGTVALLSIGLPRVEATLRMYLSLGADKAIHICDRSIENYDAYGLSLVLSQAIKGMKYDLILCGMESAGSGCAFFLGPYVAEMLGLPQVSGITKIELQDEGHLVVHRKVERGDRQVVRCPLPCLLTVETGINEPRYPTFPDSLAGITKKIQLLDVTSPGLRDTEVSRRGSFVKMVGFSPPTSRIKKRLVIDTKLSAAGRMKMTMVGGLPTKSGKQTLLTGEPRKLAEQMVSILANQGIHRIGDT